MISLPKSVVNIYMDNYVVYFRIEIGKEKLGLEFSWNILRYI